MRRWRWAAATDVIVLDRMLPRRRTRRVGRERLAAIRCSRRRRISRRRGMMKIIASKRLERRRQRLSPAKPFSTQRIRSRVFGRCWRRPRARTCKRAPWQVGDLEMWTWLARICKAERAARSSTSAALAEFRLLQRISHAQFRSDGDAQRCRLRTFGIISDLQTNVIDAYLAAAVEDRSRFCTNRCCTR